MTRRSAALLCALASVGLTTVSRTSAERVQLSAVADAMVAQTDPERNDGSSPVLHIGMGDRAWWVYLRWDIAGNADLRRATIHTVSVRMRQECRLSLPERVNVVVKAVSEPWQESSINWANRPELTRCGTGVYPVTGCTSGTRDIEFTDFGDCLRGMVQRVADGDSGDWGIALVPLNAAATHAFSSRESGHGAVLVVDYTPAPPESEIVGRVVDSATGAAVVGATVQWADRLATTDSDGRYRLLHLPCERSTLAVSQAGYETRAEEYAPPCSDSGQKDFTLRPVADIRVEPPALSVDVCEHQEAELAFTVFNAGAATLHVDSISASAASCWLTVSPPLFDVSPGGRADVTVHIQPACVPPGTYDEELTISSNDPDEDPLPGGVPVRLTHHPLPPAPAGTAAEPSAICRGESSTLTATAESAEIDWYEGSCGSTPVGTGSIVVNPTDTTVYYARARSAAVGCESEECTSVAVEVKEGPVIERPPDDVTVCVGQDAHFTLIAGSGGSLRYKWRKDGIPVGIDDSVLVLTKVTAEDDLRRITCEVTNDCGGVGSPPATLRVHAAPSVRSQPASQIACAGSEVTFVAEAGGSGDPAYVWRRDGVPIQGATGPSLTLQRVAPAHAASYDVTITNDCGTTQSRAAVLQVCESCAAADCNANGIADDCELSLALSRDCNENRTPDDCDIGHGTSPDCNRNEVPDECDITDGRSADCDKNAIPDECEPMVDCNANGVRDACDVAVGTSRDCQPNGTPDECEVPPLGAGPDCNGNGVPDDCELADGTVLDCNGNGTPDACDIAIARGADCQPDGVPDECQLSANDCNNNQIPDVCETDCNENRVPDDCDIASRRSRDCNDNDVPDACDIAQGTASDGNGNGVPDECENDCNRNGLPDDLDVDQRRSRDCNANGVPDECEGDCNANGTPDDCDLAEAPALDCNANRVPDECDIAAGTSRDCDANAIPDECEPSTDCNANGIRDVCDVMAGTSRDCQPDGVPDECQVPPAGGGADCNRNGVPDECELREGTSSDCNANKVLDACDVVDGTSEDCQRDGVPDECQLSANDCDANQVPDDCDVAADASRDCNGNRIPDACDLRSGISLDCQLNGVPDECEIDCDRNGRPDDCDLAGGRHEDCNRNAVPDVCDVGRGGSPDVNSNGVPDECEADCNRNGIPDDHEIRTRASTDCNTNGVPDACDVTVSGAGFQRAFAWATFDPASHGLGEDTAGYHGAVFDGRYVYFVPYHNRTGYHGEVLRFDTHGDFASASAWVAFDPGSHGVGDDPDGYADAVLDGRYVYFVPYNNGTGRHGEFLRLDTDAPFDRTTSWAVVAPRSLGPGCEADGYVGGASDGRFIYFVPYRIGTLSRGAMLRLDTTRPFQEAPAWTAYDPAASGARHAPHGYHGAVFDGRYLYLVPYHDQSEHHGDVLRYDTRREFAAPSSWEAYDAGANGVGHHPDGYIGGAFDGRYAYFAPYQNGADRHGEVLRYDTTASFSAVSSWAAYDPGANGVGSDPDGYVGAVFDGRFVYFVPHHNGSRPHGEVLRCDVTRRFDAASAWSAYDPGAHGVGRDPTGYWGGAFDGRYVYFAPFQNAGGWHGEVLRYDTFAGASADTDADGTPDECRRVTATRP